MLDKNYYLHMSVPLAGVAHQAGTCRFGNDPASSGIRLSDLFLATAVVAASMGALSFALARPSRLPPAAPA